MRLNISGGHIFRVCGDNIVEQCIDLFSPLSRPWAPMTRGTNHAIYATFFSSDSGLRVAGNEGWQGSATQILILLLSRGCKRSCSLQPTLSIFLWNPTARTAFSFSRRRVDCIVFYVEIGARKTDSTVNIFPQNQQFYLTDVSLLLATRGIIQGYVL